MGRVECSAKRAYRERRDSDLSLARKRLHAADHPRAEDARPCPPDRRADRQLCVPLRALRGCRDGSDTGGRRLDAVAAEYGARANRDTPAETASCRHL